MGVWMDGWMDMWMDERMYGLVIVNHNSHEIE